MRLLKLLELEMETGRTGRESWTSHHSQGKSASLPGKTKSEKKKENHLEHLWIFIDQNE